MFQFYQLAYPDRLQGVACDPAQFSTMFVFPVGTNVSAVQTALCDALTSRSSSVQELVDLFQAGDMLVQVNRDLWSAVYLPLNPNSNLNPNPFFNCCFSQIPNFEPGEILCVLH